MGDALKTGTLLSPISVDYSGLLISNAAKKKRLTYLLQWQLCSEPLMISPYH